MNVNHGSTLLLVFSVTFVLSIALLKCWKISSMRVDVQNQREKYYKSFYLKDWILRESINFTVKNFDSVLKSAIPIKIDFHNLGYGLAQRVVVKKKVKPDTVVISAVIASTCEQCGSLKCLLERKRIPGKLHTKFVVSGYTIL